MGSSFSSEIEGNNSTDPCLEGVSNSGACYCYTGWYGEFCNKSLESFWPRSFLAWRVLFSMIYISFMLYSGWVIFKSRIRNIMLKGTRTTYENKWNLTSKKLIIVLIFMMSMTRSIWLVIDPFDFNQYFRSFQINKLMNEISYSIEFSIYMVVLFIWYTLAEYTYLRSVEHNKMPRFILVLKHFGLPKAVIFYSMQILLSTIKIYKKEEFLEYIKSTQYILAGFLGFLFLEFVIMSYFLSKTLSEERKILQHQENRTRQASEKKSIDQKSNKRKQTLMPSQFLARGFHSSQTMIKQNSQQNMSPSFNFSKRESINGSVGSEEPSKTRRRAALVLRDSEPQAGNRASARPSFRLENGSNVFDVDADSERMLFAPDDADMSSRDLDIERVRSKPVDFEINPVVYQEKLKLLSRDEVFLGGLDDEEDDETQNFFSQNLVFGSGFPQQGHNLREQSNGEQPMPVGDINKQDPRDLEIVFELPMAPKQMPGSSRSIRSGGSDSNKSDEGKKDDQTEKEKKPEIKISSPPPPVRTQTALSTHQGGQLGMPQKLDPLTKSKLMIDHCLHDVVKRRSRIQRQEAKKAKKSLYEIVNRSRAANPKGPLPAIPAGLSIVDEVAPEVLEKSNWPREAYLNACTGDGPDWRLFDNTGVFKGSLLQMIFKKTLNNGVYELKDDFFGDAHRVFRRIFRMVLMVLLLLLLYSVLFTFILIVQIESPGWLLICLFFFEGVQATTCFSLLLILKKIVSNMSHTMQAIHILISIQSLRKDYRLHVPRIVERVHQDIDLNKLIRI